MKYKIKRGLISQKNKADLAIFDPEKSTLHTLNETASIIFEKIKAGWDSTKIAEYLVKKYQIKKEKAEKDIRLLMADFLKKNLVD